MSEAAAIKKRFGKWSDPGVPHKGWECIGWYDRGEDNLSTCEMCEAVEHRYAHVMQHINYTGQLEVGCVCAGHMEESPSLARERDTAGRARSFRLSVWIAADKWRRSAQGNLYRNSAGLNVVIYRAGKQYKFRIQNRNDDTAKTVWGDGRYTSETEAIEASFDAIQSLK